MADDGRSAIDPLETILGRCGGKYAKALVETGGKRNQLRRIASQGLSKKFHHDNGFHITSIKHPDLLKRRAGSQENPRTAPHASL
ncbi:hypothetical protein EW146_g9954 [Bondarzewia mesenterica]|uniref:Uncharacterized protein n=1 Tax=Bondarzewia mesenterica TaxID=1095465 RepID=A0A4S4L2B1_9AGAM|nr:hypothetical protein EW146_g9954 [Bondarzewia mesenterica]